MKTPPAPEDRYARSTVVVATERDRAFLIFAAVVLVSIALGFKSELLGPGQVWALALGLVVIAAPALLGYLRGTEEFPRIEHYIPVALGATTLARSEERRVGKEGRSRRPPYHEQQRALGR